MLKIKHKLIVSLSQNEKFRLPSSLIEYIPFSDNRGGKKVVLFSESSFAIEIVCENGSTKVISSISC